MLECVVSQSFLKKTLFAVFRARYSHTGTDLVCVCLCVRVHLCVCEQLCSSPTSSTPTYIMWSSVYTTISSVMTWTVRPLMLATTWTLTLTVITVFTQVQCQAWLLQESPEVRQHLMSNFILWGKHPLHVCNQGSCHPTNKSTSQQVRLNVNRHCSSQSTSHPHPGCSSWSGGSHSVSVFL